jgi:hypothetical protein
MAIKLSNTSKMRVTGKKVRSWSLEAGVTCPMAKDAEVCKECYAQKGMYRFPVVKAVRQNNRIDYKTDNWIDRMVSECSKYDMIRLFDSGDCETQELALKIEQVITRTPATKWWFPTRMDKSPKLSTILNRIKLLPNVAFRPSADNIGLNNNEREGVLSYVIRPEEIFEAKRQGIYVCPVGSTPNQKSCDTCTMCYQKNVKVAYVLH